MKRCPTCRREYEDDSLRFCLEDGARLAATNDTTPAIGDVTMVLPETEAAPTMSEVARPNVPPPGTTRDRGKSTEPAGALDIRTSSLSATMARIVIAVLGAISLLLVLVGFALWGQFAVRRIPINLFFLAVLVVAFVRASRHPKVSLLVGIALSFDLIETFVFISLNRGISAMTLDKGVEQTVDYVLMVLDDFALVAILILLTIAVLTGRKSTLQTAWR